MSAVIDLACELISRKSLTPEDAGCQRLIAERLAAVGFQIEWFHCDEVSNVLLTRGQGSPSLWFLGHTDVVPTGPLEDWSSPPFEPDIRDGQLYGRGAADMKGGVAAMVTALEQFAQAHPEHAGQAGLLLTSDEEGLAEHGVKAVAEFLRQRGIAPEYCLVGEPSSQQRFGDTVRIGRRGSISARLWIKGVQGHTAFPHTIDNPVHRMAPFLGELVATHWDDGDGDFPPTHCQVSNLQAGTGAENVTPGMADLMFNFRNAPSSPAAALKTRIESMLGRHDIERYRLEWRVSGEPFRSEAGPLRAAVRDIIGSELGIEPEMNTGGGTSDGRFIAPLGSEVLEFGVRNHSIHKIDEHVAVAEIEALERIYLRVLDKLLIG